MWIDLWTIARKDLQEILTQRGSLRAGLSNVLVVILIAGVLFPLQWGEKWVSSPIGLVSTIWLPLLMSMGLVADAFAGERERHTLETLLASRLSDAAILYGKMLASVLYGLGLTLAGLLLGAITANLAHPGAGFYPAQTLLVALGFSLLGLFLVSGLGVLVSLGASSVRQAYQRMSLGFMILWLPLLLGPQLIPAALQAQLRQQAAAIPAPAAMLAAACALAVLDLGLARSASRRFRRSQLLLD